ncbi:copper amine oxidase [Bacillus timonensis]|nr:copper amine oxidase [Bacillus timonensis]
MNFKKSLVIVPLSLSLLLPTTGMVGAAQNHKQHQTASVETPASELRSTLTHLLTEHAYLAIETMRKGAEGAKDFEASAGALGNNTEDLTKAIASVYGEEAGKAFNKLWSDHIGFFVDYVVATTNNDEAGKKAALSKLDNYRAEFSQFLESATGERLEAEALAEGLQMHVNQLVGAFDSYLAKDYVKAYEYEREAIHHMTMVSKGLSSAITDQYPEKFNGSKAVTPANDLRSLLDHLLTEHAALAMAAMQNGIDGSADFEASAQALSKNTDDLTAAIASVYGKDAGDQFKAMWSAHIGFFVDYVLATANKDEEAKKQALSSLDGYRVSFSTFLETATEGRLQSDALAEGLQMHVTQLVEAFDTYVEGDYEETYTHVREAYAHMLHPAKGLSGAFVSQFPEKFAETMPTDMPKTGLGGASETQTIPFEMLLLGLLSLAITTGIVLRRKSTD